MPSAKIVRCLAFLPYRSASHTYGINKLFRFLNIFLFLLILILLVPSTFAADDQYKPYLHKPNIPEHPKAKLYGKYSTELFPGAGIYTYELEVPKGTNSLQPSLTISYNSQSMKQRPSFLGAGWSLTQSYIYRDINFTPSNTTDDEFKLILNNANYDLIFDNNDGFFHTESETFARIQNLSNASNAYNQYWLITLRDGTQLRLGYNPDSELASNTGYNYALKWSLDRISDTHNNNISYIYSESPYPEDNGSVYLSSIIYNNDHKRKIQFNYENSNRPDRRKVFEQGNVLEETRRLTDISVLFNDSLVRSYHFDFISLNDEKSLTSLANITYFGNDNSSKLHTISFNYHASNSVYSNSTVYNASTAFQDTAGTDFGIRLADLNNDGFIDLLQGRQSTSEKKTWINNKTGWSASGLFLLPEYFVDGSNYDKGLRIGDLNADGFPDLIQGWGGIRKAWLSNGSAFGEETAWAPSIDFVTAAGVDEGVQFVDFNGDSKVDILQSKENGAVKKAYLNTGSGWKDVSSQWTAPVYFSRNDATGSDYGARLADVNGDGLIDILHAYNFGTQTRNAYLNNGSGWVLNNQFIPPDDFTTNSRLDNGIRLIDLNGDGLLDLFQDYANGTATDRDAWLNNGTGWKVSTSWNSLEPFTQNGKNIGRRIGDVNGDGFGDIIIGYDTTKRTLIRNENYPYTLKNITNEVGGITYLYYSPSTIFNNSGEDGLSDIGFNVWVIRAALADNGLNNNFSVKANTSYNYFGGSYSYSDSEFRGFNIVNETLSDKSIIAHYFHQNKELKGKEYKTETYNNYSDLFSKTENNYNFTASNYSYFKVNLLSAASYLHDGLLSNPKTTNMSYKYDSYGNILSKTSFGDISISGDEKYENYTFVYNISIWILGKVSKYQLLNSNYEKLRETKYFYDNKLVGLTKGDLTKQEEWLDDGTGNPVTYYNYDEFGNPYRQTDPLGRTIIYYYGSKDSTNTYPDRRVNELGHAVDYAYDVATGNLLSQTKNSITTYSKYDTFGRIIKEILPYDSNELPTKTYIYTFDGIAPEIIKVSQKTTSNNTLDTYYFYDGFANLVQIKTPADNGQQVVKNLFYDGLFRIKEEQNPYFDTFSTTLANKSNTTNITKYSYDALGRITSVINPDGTTKNTTFNKWEINDYDENENRHTYLLDAYDRIIAVTEYNTDFYLLDNETYNTTYSYNGAEELVGIRDTYGNEFNFTYDSLGRKIKLKDPDLGTWVYSYDLAGNLISQTGGGGNLITGDSFYREYNGLGQLQRVREGNTSNGRILEEYFYDANGDRIRVNRYTYTGGTNETIYTPYREWMQIRNSSGTFNFYYIYQDGTLVARKNADGTTYFYHPDHLGSTSLITDEQGNKVEDEFYSPYGESLTPNSAEENKLYTGQIKDAIDCQYYYGARYYNQCNIIFIMGDPEIQNVYDPQFLNHYSYARNNPYLFIDPDGRNARVYIDRDQASGFGHIVVGVDNPDKLGQELLFENRGIGEDISIKIGNIELANTKNERVRHALSFTGKYEAQKEILERNSFRDENGNAILPTIDEWQYDDYFEIEQDDALDRLMITKGKELTSNPWKYNAIGRSSLHYSNTILKAGGYTLSGTISQSPNFAFSRSQPSEGKTVQGGGFVSGIGYITKEGRIYPTNNPKWKPTNAPRYKPPKSKKS